VTLYEQTNELGGNFRKEYVPTFKNDYSRYVDYLKERLTNSTVKVEYETTVIPSLLKNKGYDIIVNATGVHFKSISIKGLDRAIVHPMELYKDIDFTGWNLVIVGGGLVGAEAALNVANHNGKVTIVEMTGAIASAAQKVNQQHLLVLLKEKGVNCLTNTRVEMAENNQLICRNNQDSEIKIPFNHISLCVGMESSRIDLSDFDNVITVGDADHSGIVLDAVWSAYRQCRLV